MAENKVPRIAVQVPDEYRAHFAAMAAEAGMSLSGLMSSVLLSVADDDRAAHGMPPIDPSASTVRGRKAA